MSSKSWNTPLEIEEIVNNANNWSLAGDASLLKYLEKFSDNLLAKAKETNNNLNNLLNNLEETSLRLDIAKNKFLSLQNTQFIESRVYEDDETEEQEKKDNVIDRKDEISVDILKSAVLKGIDIMNNYYEKVEVPASDSEDDNETPNFVLRPKDPYIDRPLPYVIGTEEWHKKWHVGLEDTSSEGESEKLSNANDDDSDSDLPYLNHLQNNIPKDFSGKLNQPVANSTFNDSKKEDVFDSSSSGEDNHSYPSQSCLSNDNFAQELNKKLGNIIQNEVIEDEVNTRPIMKADNNFKYPRGYSNNPHFDDEPPPLDDEPSRNNKPGLFSGGQGLFDDESDNDSLWNNHVKNDDDVLEKLDNQEKFDQGRKGLFDSDSDDDLFSTNRVKAETQKSFLSPPVTNVVAFHSDEPPEFEEDKAKKKPATEDGKTMNEDKTTKTSAVNLFEDDTDLFKEDFLSSTSNKKFSSNLFDSDDDEFLAKPFKDEKGLFDNEVVKSIFNDEDDKTINFNINTNVMEQEVINSVNQPPPDLQNTNRSAFQVDLFSSTPPPLDNDWDLPDEDSTSLFENQTPSLNFNFNQTSGIVKDMSTNLEQDVSFKPSASSTRRHSSEIYEYSSDYFLTKNSLNPPPLDTILEPVEANFNEKDSCVDITPSGVSDQLYSELSSNKSPVIDDCVFNETNEDIKQESKDPDERKVHMPGKLVHNLNINVNALLPGAYSASRVKNTPRIEGKDVVEDKNAVNVETLPSLTKSRAKVMTRRRPSTRRGRQEQLRKADGMQDLNETVSETATQLTVSKPEKLPFNHSIEVPPVDLEVPPSKEASIFDDFLNPAPIKASLFDDSEDDMPKFTEAKRILFEEKDLLPNTLTSNVAKNASTKSTKVQDIKSKGLFDEDDDDDDSLFSNTDKKKNKSIFDNQEDNLFKSSNKSAMKKSKSIKKSLFDDDDDSDDDIFGRSSSSVKKEKSVIKQRPERKKVSLTNKTANPIDDPLNVFKD